MLGGQLREALRHAIPCGHCRLELHERDPDGLAVLVDHDFPIEQGVAEPFEFDEEIAPKCYLCYVVWSPHPPVA